MCLRIVSSFTRCGDRDTVAHVQYCKNALETSPSAVCPLSEGDFTNPVYDIPGFCPKCALNHTVVTVSGHLQEGTQTISIVHQVPTPAQVKKFADVSASKQNNDKPLQWKESGPADFAAASGGWDEAASGGEWGSSGTAGEWGSSGTAGAGDWNGSNENGFAADDSFKNSVRTVSTDMAAGAGYAEDWADASARDKEDRKRSNSFAEEPVMW